MSIPMFIRNNSEYFENFITRCTYHSNSIEGSTLSYAETYAIIFNDNSFTIKCQPREIYEAINHKYALSYVIDNIEKELSEQFIKNIAIQINKNINEIDGYRTLQVFIKGSEHIPPEPNRVKQSMMYFVYNYNNTEYDSIFDKIAEKHIEFERIHPFADGNGRTGRLLINYELLKNNIPPVIIPKDSRAEYFEMISDGNIKGLSEFFKKLRPEESLILKKFGYKNKNEASLSEQPVIIPPPSRGRSI